MNLQRFTPFHLEYNSWNGLIIEILGFETLNKDFALFSIFWSSGEIDINLLFMNFHSK